MDNFILFKILMIASKVSSLRFILAVCLTYISSIMIRYGPSLYSLGLLLWDHVMFCKRPFLHLLILFWIFFIFKCIFAIYYIPWLCMMKHYYISGHKQIWSQIIFLTYIYIQFISTLLNIFEHTGYIQIYSRILPCSFLLLLLLLYVVS